MGVEVRTRLRCGWWVRLTLAVALMTAMLVDSGAAVRAQIATPTIIDPGCDRLPAYFVEVNALASENNGLAILKGVNNDALALTDTDAKQVAAALDTLLIAWDGLTPPPAAAAWHAAQRDLFAWYRDLVMYRSHRDHQRLINRDKTIVPALGRATLLGQQACGVAAWNAAIGTTPTATPRS